MRKSIYPRKYLSLIAVSLMVWFLSFTSSVNAQGLASPTPDFDGNILYTVQGNDTCLSISLRMSVDIETLRQLNNLDVNCSLVAGTQILLGRILTPTPTLGPSPTPTVALPTPTLYNGNASVCIFLFDDLNGNSTVQSGESGIPGGAVSLTKRNGVENFTGLTTGIEDLCFPEVPEGDYVVSIALPNEYNPTTAMNFELEVKAGDVIQVNFGAQKQASLEQRIQSEEQAALSQTRSPLLAILGGGLILGAVALGIVYWIAQRRNDY